MTQKNLILSYLKENDFIIPAKMSGKVFKGTMFGSEASRVCRTLRSEGKLQSERVGKFEKFYIGKPKITPFLGHKRFDEDGVARDCMCQIGENHSV